MASGFATVCAARICGRLHLADVAASGQPEDAGTLSALFPALWRALDRGPRLQPGVRPRLALALYRGECSCWGAPSYAQRLCRGGALDASSSFSDPQDAWRIGRSRLVVAHRVVAAGARAVPR